MATTKVPGIYKITNNINGKVYIGQSRDINHRFKYYRLAYNSECDYADTTKSIIKDMKSVGIENFTFEILASGKEYENDIDRAISEQFYINKYKANNPKYGYNTSIGGELSVYTPRKQSCRERLKRANPVILFSIQTRSMMLYFGGAKAVGDEFGYGKDVMSHTINRGSLFLNEYYLIPANYDERHKLLEKLREKKMKQNTVAQYSFKLYELAVSYIDLNCFDSYGFN